MWEGFNIYKKSKSTKISPHLTVSEPAAERAEVKECVCLLAFQQRETEAIWWRGGREWTLGLRMRGDGVFLVRFVYRMCVLGWDTCASEHAIIRNVSFIAYIATIIYKRLGEMFTKCKKKPQTPHNLPIGRPQKQPSEASEFLLSDVRFRDRGEWSC